jgi:hypothetical protein
MKKHTLALFCLVCQTTLAQTPAPDKPLTPQEAVELLQRLPEGSKLRLSTVENTGSGSGAGLDASGHEVDIRQFATGAPTVGLGENTTSTSGGGLDAEINVLGNKTSQLFLLGVVALVLAAGAVYLKLPMVALALGAAGLLFIFASVYPWVIFVGIVVLLGLLVYVGFDSRINREGLVSAVKGVNDLKKNPSVYQEVKDRIRSQVTPQAAEVIDRIKRKENLK